MPNHAPQRLAVDLDRDVVGIDAGAASVSAMLFRATSPSAVPLEALQAEHGKPIPIEGELWIFDCGSPTMPASAPSSS